MAAEVIGDGILFSVWAPLRKQIQLHIVHPFEKVLEMEKKEGGIFQIFVKQVPEKVRYFFQPDNDKDFPDPSSMSQPEGVHGPSEVINHSSYQWRDNSWKGIPIQDIILYEMHVGTFTPEGTFEAIIPRLDELKSIGINALELMPVNQFPGNRNWGYDGVYLYAVQNSYGGPEGLKKLVDACHQKGIAVYLDVVYNHLGPEGNYLSVFGPYFTDKYKTPWGDAINFDGAWSDGVRDFFADNPVYWLEHYHIDGLRLDAIHMIYDSSAISFWELLDEKVKALEKKVGKKFYLIAESDLNSPKVVQPVSAGGFGLEGQWLDDFHHALYTLLDPEGKDRYADFGDLKQLAKGYKEGFVHSGEWVQFRKKRHGASSAHVSGEHFVVFNLNHDQIGNRVGGERLCMLVEAEKVKLGAAALLLAPYIPMLFMGEEYADNTPFYYFVSHSDPQLIKAVQEGRKNEFKDFGFDVAPPDPQDEKTFQDSVIQWDKKNEPKHQLILQWHKALITLRQRHKALQNFNKKDIDVQIFQDNGLLLVRKDETGKELLYCFFNFSSERIVYEWPDEGQKSAVILDSNNKQFTSDNHYSEGEQSPTGDSVSVILQPWGCKVYLLEKQG